MREFTKASTWLCRGLHSKPRGNSGLRHSGSGCGGHVYRTGGDFGACSRLKFAFPVSATKLQESPDKLSHHGDRQPRSLTQNESNRAFVSEKNRRLKPVPPIPFGFLGISKRKNESSRARRRQSSSTQEVGKVSDCGEVDSAVAQDRYGEVRSLVRTNLLWRPPCVKKWRRFGARAETNFGSRVTGRLSEIVEVRVNCEQNSVLYRSAQRGGLSHQRQGQGSQVRCYYRIIEKEARRLCRKTESTVIAPWFRRRE